MRPLCGAQFCVKMMSRLVDYRLKTLYHNRFIICKRKSYISCSEENS